MSEESASTDRRIAAFASSQHGIITTEQLTQLEIDKDQIGYRVHVGRLHRVHRAVYAVGHPRLGNEGRWMAAVLALGQGAVLSHRSAAEHLALLPPSPSAVDVTVAGSGGRQKRPGIRVHRSPSLMESDVIRRDGIPVTTPARTLRDLRQVVDAAHYRRAVRQADVLAYGLGGLEADGTRSELEYLFLRLCRRHRLQVPEVNVRVGAFIVDFLWREQRVIAETDGRRFHRGPTAARIDGRRDVELRRLGYEVLRFSYSSVTGDGVAVVAEIRHALAGWRVVRTMSE